MGHLERSIEGLRPLILGSSTWDYCVLWRLGDDPSRFIEWGGCCCSGGVNNQEVGTKKRKRGQSLGILTCRDATFVHPVNTKSCEALARLPPYMSLYSGIHGEVVISDEPRWLNFAETSDCKASNEESSGTLVLIPVIGGLIELFSTNLIPENETIMQYVKSQFNNQEIETMSNSTISSDGHPVEPPIDKSAADSCLSFLNQFPSLPCSQAVIQIVHPNSESTFDGSSTGSLLSTERPSPDSTPCSISQCIPVRQLKPCHRDYIVKKEPDEGQITEKKHCKSKNLITERNRRKRIQKGILALRALVPNITKMDKASALSDACDYIHELESEIKLLHEDLQDDDRSTSEMNVSSSNERNVELRNVLSLNKPQAASSFATCLELKEVDVEVNQLGTGSFLLRVAYQQGPGAFTKLLTALGALGVVVDDVNARVCNGKMSTSFMVQTNKEMQKEDLRESLLLLTS